MDEILNRTRRCAVSERHAFADRDKSVRSAQVSACHGSGGGISPMANGRISDGNRCLVIWQWRETAPDITGLEPLQREKREKDSD